MPISQPLPVVERPSRAEQIEAIKAEEARLRAELEQRCPDIFGRWRKYHAALEQIMQEGRKPEPSFAGLPNPSCYCFMNAAVQCLRHTPRFVDAIFNPEPTGAVSSADVAG